MTNDKKRTTPTSKQDVAGGNKIVMARETDE